jgi:hypothetical protein
VRRNVGRQVKARGLIEPDSKLTQRKQSVRQNAKSQEAENNRRNLSFTQFPIKIKPSAIEKFNSDRVANLESRALPSKNWLAVRPLAQLEFRALHVAAPDIDWGAARIDDRLMRGVVQTTVAPTKLHRKSPRRLHVNVHRLTIRMPTWSHSDGRFVGSHEMISAHDIIERFDLEHYML